MQKNILVRSIAALSGIVMLASVAACGDNTATTTDNSSSSDSTSKSTPISGNFSGAGASSQQAAVEAWIAGFQGTNPEAKIAYNPSGSGAGVQTFLTGATAWAGSDKALADDEVEQSKSVCTEGTAFDVPVYISPIAVVFNLKGVSDAGKHINMDAATIAKIFDGKITKWNDPAIADQNKDLKLPDTAITVVHRSDKSGTTQNFVSYFKDVTPDNWTYDLSENWPNEVGQGAKGTSGVISPSSRPTAPSATLTSLRSATWAPWPSRSATSTTRFPPRPAPRSLGIPSRTTPLRVTTASSSRSTTPPRPRRLPDCPGLLRHRLPGLQGHQAG